MFLMTVFTCFLGLSSLDPDSVNLGWGSKKFILKKYPTGHFILRKDEDTLP